MGLISKLNSKFLFFGLVCVCSFCAGWYVNGLRYEQTLQTEINKSLQEYTKSVELARQLEIKEHKRAVQAVKAVENTTSNIISNFNNLLNDGLPNTTSNKTSNNLPPTSTATTTISNKNCTCFKRDRKKLQRLYERQLVLARDCDITTAHYNELIKLWSGKNGN